MRKILFILITLSCFSMSWAQDMYILGYDTDKEYYGVFLGKLIAPDDDKESIWNTDCTFGDNKNELSIWNVKGKYGSDTSMFSPFNADASFPPKIYDEEDNFYGYFTINENVANRCSYDILDVICRYHLNISINISKWYARLFD